MSVRTRFESKVRRTRLCWLWTGARNSYGYGKLYVGGRYIDAHRVSWQLNRGPIPRQKRVLHSCDRPRCVKPDHLFIGTQRDNMRDMARKGRQALQRVTPRIASKMRSLRKRGWTYQAIADRSGVCYATAWNVVNHKGVL